MDISYFTQEKQEILYQQWVRETEPTTRRKLLALYLKSLDCSHFRICEVCRITTRTLHEYFIQYLRGEIKGLQELSTFK